MTKDEALDLALEALYGFIPYLPVERDKEQCAKYDSAVTAIEQALAAPVQEGRDWSFIDLTLQPPFSMTSQPLRATPQALFPTLGSLQEVVDFSESKLPITDKNEMFSLLMTYHNTLLKEVNMK